MTSVWRVSEMTTIQIIILVMAVLVGTVEPLIGLYFRRMTLEDLQTRVAHRGQTADASGLKSFHLMGTALMVGGPIMAAALVWVAMVGVAG